MADFLRRFFEALELRNEPADLAPPPEPSGAERRRRPVGEPILSFRDVHLSFDRPVLRGVSFDLGPGSTKIILGGSGSGRRRSCA